MMNLSIIQSNCVLLIHLEKIRRISAGITIVIAFDDDKPRSAF